MAPRNVLVPFAAVAALLSASAQASLCVGATGIMGRVCGALDSKRVRRERRERELDGPRVRRARGSGGSYGYGGEIAGVYGEDMPLDAEAELESELESGELDMQDDGPSSTGGMPTAATDTATSTPTPTAATPTTITTDGDADSGEPTVPDTMKAAPAPGGGGVDGTVQQTMEPEVNTAQPAAPVTAENGDSNGVAGLSVAASAALGAVALALFV